MSGLIYGLRNRMLTFLLLFLLLFIHLSGVAVADEATQIDISEELSVSTCYPGDQLWVNGTATYDNSTPVADSTVSIKINGNEMEWETATDANGDYTEPISARGRFIDQQQLNTTLWTDKVHSTNWVGQTFRPNASGLHSIDIYLTYLAMFPPEPTSSFTAHISDSPTSTEDIGNATLMFSEIVIGWNNFIFPTPLEIVPDEEHYINLTSNTSSPSFYRPMGGPWGEPIDLYEDGVIYWNDDPPADPDQDLAFITYYEETLQPGEYTISVNVTGANSTETLYGYNEATLTVVPVPIADIHLTGENMTLIHDNDPILEGDEVTIDVILPNVGDVPALNFLVNFSLDSENNVFDSQIVTIDPFSEDVLSAQWTAVAGYHTIIVTADSSDVVSESLESNNNATVQFFVDGDNDSDGVGNQTDLDDDNDGYPDALEIAQGTDSLDELSLPPDNDGDFTPDNLDPDDDNDGYGDDIESAVGTDPFDDKSVPDDIDDDGTPDSLDFDMDDDGVVNENDEFPYDSTEWLDTDSDGTGNNADSDDDADGTADEEDPYPLDTDNDGMANTLDWDDDADGIPDSQDTKPLDTDNDGLRNDADADDDGDGLSDEQEREKNTNPLKQDTDGDGVNDKADYDPLDSGITSEQGFEVLYLLVPIIVIIILVLLAFFSSRGLSFGRSPGVGGGFEELPEVGADHEVPAEPSTPPPPPGVAMAPGEQPREDEFDELADLEEEFEDLSIESKAEK